MKFLVDESLSSRFARLLTDAGHDAVHLGDLGLLGADNEAVLERAGSSERVLISADTDFGELLAHGSQRGPSLLLLRRAPHRVEAQAALVLAAIPLVQDDLAASAIVVVSADRLRIRLLPIDRAF